MRSFDVPFQFRSQYIAKIKKIRADADKTKKDLSPTELTFDRVKFYLPRHFGFCFGVQHAVEKAFDIIDKNPNKNIFLISEIIHNPEVNNELKDNGLKFIQNTKGEQLISWDEIQQDDIVIIPAFGTTVTIENQLKDKGIAVEKFDTTCPFVERVWNKGEKLGKEGYTIVIHGDPYHEETRATMTRISQYAPAVIVSNERDADMLREYILQSGPDERDWNVFFKQNASKGFSFRKNLDKIAVVNQTTMLAEETQKIADFLKDVMIKKFGEENIDQHFGSTRDTLCYATNDNQNATKALLNQDLDVVFVAGGFNSANTTHLVEILAQKQPTYFINTDADLESDYVIRHFDPKENKLIATSGYLPKRDQLKIGICSGASCPDATIERILMKLLSYTEEFADLDKAITQLEEKYNGL